MAGTRQIGVLKAGAAMFAAAVALASVGAAQAMIVSVDQLVVYKNGVLAFNDTFDDGAAPPNAPNFESGTPASYFSYGAVAESGGKTLLYGENLDSQGKLLGPQGNVYFAQSITPSGLTLSNNLVRESGIQLLTSSNSSDLVTGLKSDDDIVTMALLDLQAPTSLSTNYGLVMEDRGPIGSGTRDDILRTSVLRGTAGSLQGLNLVGAWRTDESQSPSVISEGAYFSTNMNNSQILFRQSTAANDNLIHAEFAYVNSANFDITDQNAVNALTFQSLGMREAFRGEEFTRVKLRVFERIASVNLLQMTTASPTSVSQTVSTGSDAFAMTFNYRFDTPTGTLDVILDGTVIGTYLASGGVSTDFASASILIDSLLLDLTDVDLEFRITNPTSDPSTVLLDSVYFPGLVNGNFGDGTNGWQITTSNPANVSVATVFNTAPVGVPEPATLALFGFGLVALGMAARRRKARAAQILIALTCTGMVTTGAQAAPFFMGLGDLTGGVNLSEATAVAGDGSVVVGYSSSANGIEAFRWTQAGGMVGLGDLLGGTFASVANAVSVNGSVVVGSGRSALSDPLPEGLIWTQAGGTIGLGEIAGGLFSSDAQGISADGSVVVGRTSTSSGSEAFRWTQAGSMIGLGDLAGGSFNSSAWATSNDGTVVVGHANSANGNEAFRWTQADGMIGLGELAGGDFSSHALATSGDGSVVAGHASATNGFEAFLWTEAGGMVGLGDLAGGSFSSVVQAISDDGSILVGHSSTANGTEAFIWDAANGMRLLEDVLVNDYGLDLAGWKLNLATGISDDGLVIAGRGLNASGVSEAWIANLRQDIVAQVPEPATLALYGFGLAGIGLAGQRRRSAVGSNR